MFGKDFCWVAFPFGALECNVNTIHLYIVSHKKGALTRTIPGRTFTQSFQVGEFALPR